MNYRTRIRFLIFVVLFTAVSQSIAIGTNHVWKGKTFESKWDRVKDKAKSIFWGGVATRLQAKDEILEVLLKQEENYPIVYVDVNATGKENGSSWEDAFTDIQDAVDYLYDQGLEGWVWVAKGLYSSSKNPRSVVIVKQGIMLFGGFNGDETTLAQRDSVMHETIIQGWVGSEGKGQRGVDMQHLTLLDGFTIRNSGFTKGVEWQYFGDKISGGGIRTRSWLSIIRNNIIYECHAKGGAAIQVYALNEGTSYIYNTHNVPGYDPIIERNIMYRNHAVCGAVQLRNSETLFYQNIMYNNFHLPPNGEEDRSKGVEMIMHTDLHDPPLIINCILWKNTGNSTWTPDLYNNKYRSDPPNSVADSYYNCVEKGGYGPGLIESDPQFVDPDNNNFMLKETSPCIDAGYPDAPPDPDGSRADIGIPITRFQVFIDKGEAGGIENSDTWYYPGTFVDISVDQEILDEQGTTRFEFAGWIGEGKGSYSGPSRQVRIQVNSNITEKVVWKIQRKVQIISNTDQDNKSGWYDQGDTVIAVVPSYLEEENKIRRKFVSWTGIGDGSYSGTDTTAEIIVLSPVVQTVNWQSEYYVDISTDHGTAEGTGWYSEGSTVQCSIDSTIIHGDTGARYIFQGWEGTGTGAYTGPAQSFSIVVYNPVTETVKWKPQYYLTVKTERGSAVGEGWYDSGSKVVISVDTVENVDSIRRYHFWKWKGTGTGSYTGTDVTHEITVEAPVTQSALWRMEYRNIVNIDPPGYGYVTPVSENGTWWPEGVEIELLAFGNADSGYGFVRWTGDMESTDNPLVFSVDTAFTLTAHFELGDVRIETNPEGLEFKADGSTYKAPRVFYWLPGEEHTLEGIEEQTVSEDTQYVFDHWVHGGDRTHKITIPEGKMTYTAAYKEKFSVKVVSKFNNSTVKGAGWYFKGSTVVVDIDSLTDPGQTGERSRFVRWLGSGDGSVTSERTEIEIIVKGPVVEEAEWQKQFLLDTKASPVYGGNILTTPSGQWFDSTATVSVLAVPVDTNFTFTGWSGYYNGTNNPVAVNMYANTEMTAHFSTTTVFPPKISSMPAITVLEDDTAKFSYFDMYNYVQDLNDSMDRLKFSTSSPNFTVFNDTMNLMVMIIPDENWNGTEDIMLKVTDPYNLSDSAAVHVSVIPVSDPPGSFSLISPESGFTITNNTNPVNFVWHSSENVDKGDSVYYVFYMGKDSTFKDNPLTIETGDTSLYVNLSMISGLNYWSVKARDMDGYLRWADEKRTIAYFSGISEKDKLPEKFDLSQNYPNPFNSSTAISFTIPESGNIRVFIRDAKGREIKELVNAYEKPGSHVITWNGKDNSGQDVGSGMYFIEVVYKGSSIIKKMLLVR